MSGIKISELTETQSIQGGCCFPLVSGNDTKKITYNSLKAAILSELGDYIVEQGISGIWTFRKWHSGTAECWLTNGFYTFRASSMTANGNLFESDVKTLDLPTGLFTESPNAMLTVKNGGGMWTKATGGTTKDTLYFELLRTNNTIQDIWTSIYCIGK